MKLNVGSPSTGGFTLGRGIHQVILVFGVVAVFLVMTGGCTVLSDLNLITPSAPPATLNPNPTPATETPTPVAPTATPQANAHHLILWLPPQFDPHSGTAAGDLLNDRLNSFLNAHPGLTIEIRLKSVTGSGGLLDSLSTTSAAAPGAMPSLIALPRSEMETAAIKGLIYSWNDLIKPGSVSEIYPFAASLGKVQGTLYGLPFAGDALVMVYRPLQVGYAPASWSEYASREYPVIFPAGDPQALLATQMLLSAAPENKDTPESLQVDQENLKKTFYAINEGATRGAFPYWLADFDTFDKGYQAFRENRANYAVVWASSVLNRLPENVSIAPLPGLTAAPFTLADGWMWALTNTAEDQRQNITALVEYLLDPEFLASWTEAANLLPTSQDILKLWKNQADAGTINQIESSALMIPSTEFSSAIGPILQQGTLGIVRGQINYLQAIENSQKDLQLVVPTPGG